MSEMIDKQAIARSFGKAADKYDSVAHFQRWVCAGLLDKIPELISWDVGCSNLLDLGCGTGSFYPALRHALSPSNFVGVDLSENMVRHAASLQGDAQWMVGDAENLPIRDNSVDLIFSSLAIQWCGDLPSLFDEANRVLKSGGLFVFSSLVDGSLDELKRAWAKVDGMQHVNAFSSIESYQDVIDHSPLNIRRLEVEKKVLYYKKVSELTRELKTLGAHNMTSHRSTTLTGKSRVRKFLAEYETFRLDDGTLPASYQVLWGVLSKPVRRET